MPTPESEDVIIDADDIVGPHEEREHDAGQAGAAEPPPQAAPAFDANALLQSLASGSTDPMSLLLSQIAAKAPENPSVGMLTALLQRRDQPSPEPDEDDQAEGAERLSELNTMVDQLYAEVEMLRSRSVELAAALGACCVCFGTDLLCRRCGGRGRPGSRAPRPDAYRVYVVPAVRRVRRIVEAERRDDSPPPRPAGSPTPFPDQGGKHVGL